MGDIFYVSLAAHKIVNFFSSSLPYIIQELEMRFEHLETNFQE